MKCQEFERVMQECMDTHRDIDTIPEFDASAAQHLAECEACHQLQESYRILSCGIENMRAEEFEVDLVDRVVPLIETAKETTANFQFNWYKIGAIAASVIVAISAIAIMWPGNNENRVAVNSVPNSSNATNHAVNDPSTDSTSADTNASRKEIEAFANQLTQISWDEIQSNERVENINRTIDSLRPYYIYTQQLPVAKPVSSITITVDAIRRSMENQKQPDQSGNPDIGATIPHRFETVV